MTNTASDFDRWLPSNAAFASLHAHRMLKAGGPDAAEFLQGQFSNDIAALGENPGQLSSFNSAKGRVLAFLRVLKHGDDYRLAVDEEIFDAFLQRLKMFVLRAKVVIEPAGGIQGVAAVGAHLTDALAARNLPAPEPGRAIAHAGCVFLGIPGPVPRVEIFGPADALPAADASADDLARWDILFGLPRITEANRDAHVAQHLNLDELGAISFKKGCYTGQEIVARMKYLGKVKKRAAVFLGGGASAGDSVRTEDGKAAGEVVNVAPADGNQLILAVVNLEARDETLTVNDQPLQRLP
ncbi:MAG TPA: folate-binding protein [Gammaproteobacteria bacterium]